MADPRSWADAEHQLNACRLELVHQGRVSAGLQMRAELAESSNRDLEAALRAYYTFHTSYEIREGHRKKCNRWAGLECTCGGDDILALVRDVLPEVTVPNPEGVKT